MRKIMTDVNSEVERQLNEYFIIQPLNKQIHLRFKEIAINYEISLELKAK